MLSAAALAGVGPEVLARSMVHESQLSRVSRVHFWLPPRALRTPRGRERSVDGQGASVVLTPPPRRARCGGRGSGGSGRRACTRSRGTSSGRCSPRPAARSSCTSGCPRGRSRRLLQVCRTGRNQIVMMIAAQQNFARHRREIKFCWRACGQYPLYFIPVVKTPHIPSLVHVKK